ncbi:HNH endonuclease [Mucilaginibacter metallidurans]|nr:HNH endonuclease [Mucilaginibacter gossypii]
MNRETLFGFGKFLQEYDVLVSFKIDEDDRKPLILERNSFVCRFCGKQKPEVTFKKRAHALPEFIGNGSLFTHCECDDCNGWFGRELEVHFASFMHLNHTMFGVRGKKGYPKFKTTDGTEIVNDGGMIDWQGIPMEQLNHDEKTRTLTATQKVPSFIPANVFKALVKMALTIMPAAQLLTFADTMSWLNAPLNDPRFTTSKLWLAYGAIGSSDRFPHIGAALLKRKKLTDLELVPMIFRLNYGNFQFDVPVPMFHQGKMIPIKQIPYLPNLFDLRDGYGTTHLRLIDFSFTAPVKDHSMSFELVDLDGTGTVETIAVN